MRRTLMLQHWRKLGMTLTRSLKTRTSERWGSVPTDLRYALGSRSSWLALRRVRGNRMTMTDNVLVPGSDAPCERRGTYAASSVHRLVGHCRIAARYVRPSTIHRWCRGAIGGERMHFKLLDDVKKFECVYQGRFRKGLHGSCWHMRKKPYAERYTREPPYPKLFSIRIVWRLAQCSSRLVPIRKPPLKGCFPKSSSCRLQNARNPQNLNLWIRLAFDNWSTPN